SLRSSAPSTALSLPGLRRNSCTQRPRSPRPAAARAPSTVASTAAAASSRTPAGSVIPHGYPVTAMRQTPDSEFERAVVDEAGQVPRIVVGPQGPLPGRLVEVPFRHAGVGGHQP